MTSDNCGNCGVLVLNGDAALECGGACKNWYHLQMWNRDGFKAIVAKVDIFG